MHSHLNTLSFIPLYAAKLADIPVRICHSHSTAHVSEGIHAFYKYALRPLAPLFATHLFSCSDYAGKWLYGKKREFYVMRNGIDIERFRFSEYSRKRIREQYEISEEEFVVGHVGRFMFQKNHEFLVRIFDLLPIEKKRLLLVGDGQLLDDVKKQVAELGLSDRIIFVGSVEDTAPCYSAMDVFCLPSRFEGLAVVRVEALSAGCPTLVSARCPCLVSTGQIPELGNFDEGFINIDDGDEQLWVEAVMKKKELGRIECTKQLRDCGFDIQHEAEMINRLYLDILNIKAEVSITR